MRRWCWLAAMAVAAARPAAADAEFQVRVSARNATPGAGECNIKLVVHGETQATLHGDSATVTGDARNDGSECTAALAAREIRGMRVEGSGAELLQAPAESNGYKAVVRVHGNGRAAFHLTWQTGPAGFAWNNAVRYKTRGRGEAKVGDVRWALSDIDVAMDLSGKIVVSFAAENKRTLSFSGVVNERDAERIRADVVCDGPEWRVQGPLILSIDAAKERVTAASLEGTDGRDRMSLSWSRR